MTPNEQLSINLFTVIISITSGFIVCLFSAVINKYVGSVDAYNEILRLQREITTYLESVSYDYTNKSVYYTIYHTYNQIILISSKLMYKSDYRVLSSNLYNMLSFIKKEIDINNNDRVLNYKQKQLKAYTEQLPSFQKEVKVEAIKVKEKKSKA